jgi:hypothetical protein
MWAASLEKAKQPTSASAISEAFGCRCWAFFMLAPAWTALRLGSLLASLSRLTHILQAVLDESVVVSWEGDPQATAPIGRGPGGKASTNVIACFGIVFRKRFVAFQPRILFEFESLFFLSLEYSLSLNRGTLASILSAYDMHQGCVFVLSMVFQFALLRGSNSSWEVVTTESNFSPELWYTSTRIRGTGKKTQSTIFQFR